ncbi:MAG TPA: hypothetical protein VMW63_05505 [Methanoregulaceae archaeon]|nr:hypothetical protein [Methanoregulaceae archaeon]
MIKDEIDKIKAAEEEAISQIQNARERAAELQVQAKEQVELRLKTALEQAAHEIDIYRDEKISLADRQVSEIAFEATKSAESLQLEYEKRMSGAVAHIVKWVTGEDCVLSSTYEKSDNRSP